MSKGLKNEAIAHFCYEGILVDERPWGSGHINDTYLLTFDLGEGQQRKIILQRMNKSIFTKPVELMENIMNVTTYLREKIIEHGGDPERETLNVIPAADGKPYYVDSEGQKHYAPYWTDAEVEEIYKLNKSSIPDAYNLFDFMVTLNMIKSDYHNIVEGWFEGADNEKRYIELAINWLDDDDNPFGEEKVWKYFNS